MNALVLIVISSCVFAIGYRYYAAFIAAKVLALDPRRKTPAFRLSDGRDYVPTNKWVLFGHHFASIAGAGPLIGPVLAAQFGYLPGFLWIVIGAVLAGAVHDMVILFASVRHNGRSLSRIAGDYMKPSTGWATAIAVIFIIITALAGLAIAVVNALSESPWATFTVVWTMPVAVLVGVMIKGKGDRDILKASAIGFALVLIGIVAGRFIGLSAYGEWFTADKAQLSLMLPLYGFVASILPVWLLMAPRDYISSYMKIGTIALLALGIGIVRPKLQMPAVTEFVAGGGPVISGAVWPYVCITIACGAISGFHALIGSGTTPKMLRNEKDIVFIGYGAMVFEGFVAVMALIAATVLVPADYFAINCPAAVFEKLGIQPVHLQELSRMVGEDVAGRPGGAVSLAVGMSYIFSSIPGMKQLMSYWYHFAIMFEAVFILTTIDTGTRVARYIFQDIFGKFVKPFARQSWMPGVLITSALTCVLWGYLLYNGDIATIWPMFGVANQLLATIALAIGTVFIVSKCEKKRMGLVTFIPMVFMFVTTMTAGIMNIFNNYLPGGTVNGYINALLTVFMLALACLVIWDAVCEMYRLKKNRITLPHDGHVDEIVGEVSP
jgi:carbon starvation protein